jgi:hypothetical protein
MWSHMSVTARSFLPLAFFDLFEGEMHVRSGGTPQ